MPGPMILSVIIPTVTGREGIYKTVESAYRRTGPAGRMEIITLVDKPTVGVAWQSGAAAATGDYIHLANDDCEPRPGWWQPAAEACDQGYLPSAQVYTPDGFPQGLPDWGKVAADWTPVKCCLIPFMSRGQWQRISPLFLGHYYCVTPDTPVLTSAMEWTGAGKLNLGDDIVGVDEFPEPFCDRKFRHAVVTGNERRVMDCLRLTLDDGREVTCTPDHAWLTKTYRRGNPANGRQSSLQWIETSRLRPGDLIASPFQTWRTETSYDAGWLAGVFDGEGSAGRYRSGDGYEYTSLAVAQNPGPVLNRITATLDAMGIRYSAYSNARTSRVTTVKVSPLPQILELLGRLRPERLLPDGLWEGAAIRTKPSQYAKVASVKPVGKQEIIALGTSTGTFIANGLVSHNTDNFITDRARSAGYPCVLRTGYAFTHHWAMAGRGAGMSQDARMAYDETLFRQAMHMAEDGKWTEPWPPGGSL